MADAKTENASKPIDKGMMDLFAATTTDDASQGKLVAMMKDIEITALLKDATWVRDHLRGAKTAD